MPGSETRTFRLKHGCAEGIAVELWMGEGSGHAPGYGDGLRERPGRLVSLAGLVVSCLEAVAAASKFTGAWYARLRYNHDSQLPPR